MAATSGLGNHIDGSRNEIWLCPGYSRGGHQLMLYVKLGLPTRAMLVEALCAQLAHCIGLNGPEPYLVRVQPQHVGRERGKGILAFAAEDLSERSMARPVRDLEQLLGLFRSHRIDDLACAFDEWIANDVRSPTDILVSPEPRLYMIDHEAALAEEIRSNAAVTNWLADRLLQHMSDGERPLFLRKVRARLAALQRVSLKDVPLASQYAADGVVIYGTLLQFLKERLQHLDRLISQRILPEQGYLVDLPDKPDATHDAAG